MLHFKFLLALLPVLSVAAQTGNSRRLRVARQTSAADCTTPCEAITNAVSSSADTLAGACTNDVASDYVQCYNCEVSVGALTQQAAQQVVDAYTQGCSAAGHAVNSITVTASGSGGAGATTGGAATGGAATGGAATGGAAAGSTPASGGSTPTSGGSTPAASGPSKKNGAVKMSAGLGLTTAVVLLAFVI
ncbi:hypothetical protein K438DRAFT_1975184 [Mycena galopus ATCC 62051]|nr:hypothetical protein K438DRAFT_1975184 [Mycena galopus ATCC 62051]